MCYPFGNPDVMLLTFKCVLPSNGFLYFREVSEQEIQGKF